MAWARWGDTSATHPIPLKVLEHEDCDDRLLNEVHGFISRCAAEAGSHKTDYVVTRGTAVLMAGPSRVEVMLEVAIFAGYLTEVTLDGSRAYKLVDDDPDFLHLRLKAEIEFEQQRRKDNSTPSLVVPVRLRDGDACRWCGRIVDWGSRKAGRSGTYDHLIAGQAASVDTYVVCCQSCNSSRKNGERPGGIEHLLPVPDRPYYSTKTVEWLEGNEWRKRNGLPVPPRPRKRYKPGDLAPGLTPAANAPVGDRPDNRSGTEPSMDTAPAARPVSPAPRTDVPSANAPTQQRPEPDSGTAQRQPPPAQTSDLQTICGSSADSADDEGTESVGAGRVGTGRDGSGQPYVSTSPTAPTSPSKPRRKRGRRRRRSGTQSSPPQATDPHTPVADTGHRSTADDD